MVAYPYAFLLHGRTAFLIWLEDETGEAEDRVKLDDRGALLMLDDLAGVVDACRASGMVLADEEPSGPLDLDRLQAWIDSGGEPDPTLLLDAWNLFGDVARSVGVLLDDRRSGRDAIYNKVFAANNLPAVTPPGERYEPQWSESELDDLRKVVGDGLRVSERQSESTRSGRSRSGRDGNVAGAAAACAYRSPTPDRLPAVCAPSDR